MWWLNLICLTSIVVTSLAYGGLNNTCMDIKISEVQEKFQQSFQSVAQIPIYNYVQVIENHRGTVTYFLFGCFKSACLYGYLTDQVNSKRHKIQTQNRSFIFIVIPCIFGRLFL